MKHQEKPKYSIWQNVCFMVRTAWSTYKRVLVICVVAAVIQIALNLVQLYVSPEILAKVEQGASVGELLRTIGIFTAALFLLQGLKSY
ncbi:MAG: ABC transporter ATP-binding protein, partial [Negativibacillus sp.]|nr:ABC transporter ATP-binding protein [Negativibacillus sp.]